MRPRGPPLALCSIHFHVRPGALTEPWGSREELGAILIQIGHAVAAGRHDHTGTIIVPRQGRVRMKAAMELFGPDGKRMWRNASEYDDLNEVYAADVGSAAAAVGSFVDHLHGDAVANDKAYVVTWTLDVDGPGGVKPMKTKAERLLYHQVLECQRALWKMADKLIQSGEMEVASSQRK